jgi:hypothetical protein
MTKTLFHRRRAVCIENEALRVTLMIEGGHIAEIQDRATGINPLWVPPWVDDEDPDYGHNSESPLLATIMGHNLCLDLFGPPSEAEAAAGLVVHGEAGVTRFDFDETAAGLTARCVLPAAQLAFERAIALEGRTVRIRETVENLSIIDRPIAWTQHVTLGPPFLEHGVTEFRWRWSESAVLDESYTAYLMGDNPEFVAWSPAHQLAFGYRWNRADFPWMGVWKENCGRTQPPWNGRTITQGMEFGVSPFPEPRRAMIDRGRLFDTPCYRWIGAKQKLTLEYSAFTESPAESPQRW